MSSIEGIRQRLESLFAGVADAIPTTGPLVRSAAVREAARPRGWVWELDLEGRYTWCSPEIERILGYARDEVQGKLFSKLGFDASTAEDVQKRLSAGEPIQQLIVGAETKSGQSIQIMIRAMHRINTAGEALGFRGVTQLIDADSAPSITRERMVIELPTPPEDIGATTPPTFAPSWGKLLGFEDVEGVIQPIEGGDDSRTLLSEETGTRIVVPLQVQDEIIGVIEIDDPQAGGFWHEDQRALANAIAHELAITLQDARSYQLTQQALEEMREADRLKSQFLANMSHELRTPLNSIIGFSRVILKGIDGPITDTQEQDLNAIYNAGQHLLGLINNILDISKIEAGKMELAFTDVDLAEIIRGVMATAVGLVKDKPIELITDVPEELPLVQADNIRIRQVLLNLVSNATKFTEQGHIGVSVRTIRRGNQSEVVVAVFDTGPGIEQDDQERIFEPFSQVDASPTRKTGGTGLGLSISRHLVELHAGVIWVESIPGEGSTFAFTLPYDPETQFARVIAPLILGIDHDPSSLSSYRSFFENSGYRFHTLADPDEASGVFKTLKPEAVILDLLNADLLVWDVLAALLADQASLAIPIFLAAMNEQDDQATLFPFHHWLPAEALDETLVDVLGTFKPSLGANSPIMVVEPDDMLWSSIEKSLGTGDGPELLRAGNAEEIHAIHDNNRLELVLIDLSVSPQLLSTALDLFGSSDLPVVAILPKITKDSTLVQPDFLLGLQESQRHRKPLHLEVMLKAIKAAAPASG